MAALTRDQMVTELQSRGWSRFAAADLQRYLDWALRDLYVSGRFEHQTRASASVAATAMTTVTVAGVETAGSFKIGAIEAVSATRSSGDVVRLSPATEQMFLDLILPASRESSPNTGDPTHYYLWDETIYIYPKPSVSTTITVDVLTRETAFTGGSDTTGLPEEFDKVVVALAEVHCYRRAHDYEGMAVAQNHARQMILDEMGATADRMREQYDRIERYDHGSTWS